jgi:predicted DNA-binding transcriptional regulator AlpA
MSQRVRDTDYAATYLNLSKASLERRRSQGQPPRFIKLGKKVGYLDEDLEAFIQESIRVSTAEPAPDKKPAKQGRQSRQSFQDWSDSEQGVAPVGTLPPHTDDRKDHAFSRRRYR